MDLSRAFVDLAVLCIFMMSMAAVLIGWGRLLFGFVGISAPKITDVSSVWMGFVSVLFLIEFLHLFLPIDWKVTFSFALVGLLSFVVRFKPIDREAFSNALSFIKTKHIYVLSALIFALVASGRAMEAPGSYDSGLYHFGSIKWLNDAPLIPGLANVHMRFGFNQSYFGYLALTNIAPYWNKGYAAGGLFLLLLSALTIVQLGLQQSQQWRLIFFISLFIYLATVIGVIANPTPDTAIDLLEVCIFIYLFRLLQSTDSTQSAQDAVVTLLLCAAAITIKLSSVIFAGGCFLIALTITIKRANLSYGSLVRGLLVALTFGFVHILRSVLLSGVPFFPNSSMAQFSLPWAVTYGVPQYESLMIYSWARTPGSLSPMKVLESWDWFVPWLNRISLTTRLVFGLAIFSTLLNIWPSFKKYQNLTTAKTNWLYLPIWSAFLFWLFTAPDLRFLGPILALHIALSTWQFLQGHCANPDQPSAQPAFNKSSVGVFAVVCVIMFKLGAVDSTTHAGWRNIPSTTTTDKRTDYDFEIRMPVSNDACWDAALPCTPYFNGNLHQVPLKISIFGTPIIDRYYFSVIPK